MASTFKSHQKTAVLVITTHGGVKVEFSSTIGLHPVMTTEPDGMDIVLLQTAACGVVNMVPPSKVVSYTKVVRDAINASGFNNNTTKSDMVAMVERIKSEIMGIDNLPPTIAKEISSKTPGYADDPQTMDYHHHNNKFYNMGNSISLEETDENEERGHENNIEMKIFIAKFITNNNLI